jgi:hypothetical protein
MALVLPFDGSGQLLPGQIRAISPRYIAVPDGLVGYWGFDLDCVLAGGLTDDLSANYNVGTLSTSGGSNPTYARGQVGDALLFDGSTNYVDMGNILNITGPITVAAWANATTNTGRMCVASKGLDLNAVPYDLCVNADAANTSKMQMQIFNGVQHVATSAANVATGIWEHWVGTADGTSIKLYRNGVLDAITADATLPSVNSAKFQVGALNNFGTGPILFWNGSIDDVRIYNRALDASEVATLYQAGLLGQRHSNLTLLIETELFPLTKPPVWLPIAGIDKERLPPVRRSLDEPPGPFFIRSPNPVPTTRRLPTAGIDRERLPPVRRALDEPPGPFFARSPHPVPTGAPPRTGENRERDMPPARRPDEPFAWFVRSPNPVPTRWLPTAGIDRERLPAIKRPPDEPPGAFIISSLPATPAPVFALPRSYEDIERLPPIKENPDPARQWFVQSPNPVPIFVVPKSGEDVERIFPIRENPDPSKQWFIRSPSPVPGFAWFGAWDQPRSRPGVDQYVTVYPTQPLPGAAVGIPWWRSTAGDQLPAGGFISDQYTTSWVPFATSTPVIVTVAVHAPQFFSTMGSMIGSPANPPS